MGVEAKIGGKLTPQIIHLFIGFGTIIFTIHFGGKNPLFLETPISSTKNPPSFCRFHFLGVFFLVV